MTCFVVDGKSVLKWCQENGACYSAFWYAMEHGYSLEKAMKKAMGAHTGHKYYYKETPLSEVFKKDKNAYLRAKARIRNGSDPIKAVEFELNRETAPQRANEPRYFLNGKSIAGLFGSGTAKYQRVLRKVRSGFNIREAVFSEQGK